MHFSYDVRIILQIVEEEYYSVLAARDAALGNRFSAKAAWSLALKSKKEN
jgi:hypothetical protein